MDEKITKGISKFLSFVLRHSPETIGLSLDENGWANVDELLQKSSRDGKILTIEMLTHVVESNDKKRFAFNNDKTKIRASQGHSIEIELNLMAVTPPEQLYHGTVAKYLEGIKKEGLLKMSRQHVHLSKDKETAVKVGSRRGLAQILTVNAGEMHRAGFQFFLSDNGVWLTDSVPENYIAF
ncbi:RNA 2'-phosphotransferase [Pedobacter kyungheensis]|uniref:Probable RNA 2'-phosphotransferase n=1 Tax=Pedobacter kyungheensis TaxID=1069985 RepID=A0A0C1FZX8_9SPHI|nr:RNA 2'-phosphotransferase [Pedobacter kyungheensis]KIA93394.1 RNA 2'-phosphotransferase [Pedobacter kyungheensis]